MDSKRHKTHTVYYICGPMTGYEDYNFPLFHAVTKILRDRGLECVNPAEVDHDGFTGHNPSYEHQDYLRDDITKGLLLCNAIVLLPGWTKSRGALVEFNVAVGMGFAVYYWDDARHALLKMS
jgi:hypothetical protein